MQKEWQSRPLESIYAVEFMDAIHFHVRSEGQIVKKAVYIAIGIQMDGAEHWANLSTYFKYPQEVRKLIYTTNSIEGFNRQFRKVTKSKSVFPTDDRLNLA